MRMRRAGSVGLAIILALTMPASALAQTPAQISPADDTEAQASRTDPALSTARIALPAGITCLRRQVTNNGAAPFAFTALAPSADTARMTKRGLAPAACQMSPAAMAGYQKMVCDMVTQGNDAVQNRLEEVFGAQPKDLCAAARKVAPLMGVAAVADPARREEIGVAPVAGVQAVEADNSTSSPR